MSKEPTPAEVASGQQSGKAESRTSLARTLGRSMATLMTAAMIIGTGIFGAIGSATAKAGSGILIAMVLGGLIALATGILAGLVPTLSRVQPTPKVWINLRVGKVSIRGMFVAFSPPAANPGHFSNLL